MKYYLMLSFIYREFQSDIAFQMILKLIKILFN